MNQRKLGVILSYVYVFLSNGISLFYTPYMLRMMGQSEYGLNGTAMSITSYLSLLSFGIGGSYIRFNVRYRANNDIEGERRLNGMFFTIFAFLSLIVIIVGAVMVAGAGKLTENSFTETETVKLRIIITLLIINTVVVFLFTVIVANLMANEEFIIMKVVSIVIAVITPLLNIIALKCGGRAISITAISLVLCIAMHLSYYICARKKYNFKFSFRGFKWSEIKEVFIFSSFLFLNSISDQITTSTDNVVLSAVKGTAAVSVYTIGASFQTYFLSLSSTIAGVFTTQINRVVVESTDLDEINRLYIKISRIQFYIISLLLIGFTCIGHEFIVIWAGKEYYDSYWIGLILMVSSSIPLFQNLGLEIQKAFNKHKARSIVYLLVAFVNIGLTIPFAKKWGGIGAALATFICVWCGQVIWMNYYYAKHIHLNMKSYWKSILSVIPSMILPIIVGVNFKLFWNFTSIWDVLFVAIIIMIVYSFSVWMFGLNDYEKNIVKKPIKKLVLKVKKTS